MMGREVKKQASVLDSGVEWVGIARVSWKACLPLMRPLLGGVGVWGLVLPREGQLPPPLVAGRLGKAWHLVDSESSQAWEPVSLV